MRRLTLAVHIVVHGGLEQIVRCVEALLAHTPPGTSIRIWDNASDAPTSAYLTSLAALPSMSIYVSPRNFGFGGPHNSMMADATEDVVCLLNSDVTVPDRWTDTALEVLANDPEVAAAGPTIRCFRLTWYIEGSCLFLRRDVAIRLGPFDSRTFRFAYCEDVDLSARLTAAGWRLAELPLSIWHEGQATSARVQNSGVDVDGIRIANEMTFLRRWPHAPRPERIVIRRTASIGDVIGCTPALRQFRMKFPQARIDFETECPDALVGNPDINCVRRFQDPDPKNYFIHFNLDGVHERNNLSGSPRHPTDLFAEALGVSIPSDQRSPRLFLAEVERRFRHRLPQRYIVFATDAGWAIKVWLRWRALTQAVRRRWPHVSVVWLGMNSASPAAGPATNDPMVLDLRGRTKLRQAFAVIEGAEAVVSNDTGLLHVAGAFLKPTVGLFGPVRADMRLNPGQIGVSTSLECRGCYHHQSSIFSMDPETKCYRANRIHFPHGLETAPCMAEINVERVLEALYGIYNDLAAIHG